MQDFFIWWDSLDNFFRNAFPLHFHTAVASVLYQMLFCHESNCFLIFSCLKTCLPFLSVSVGPMKSISCFFKSCSFSIIRPSHRHCYYDYLYMLPAPNTSLLVLLKYGAVLMRARCGSGLSYSFDTSTSWGVWLHLYSYGKICKSGVR